MVAYCWGKGFSDEFCLAGPAHAVLVRSPHPHALIDAGKSAAAEDLEAAETNIRFGTGPFSVAGPDHMLPIFQPAALAVIADNEMYSPVFSNGCHVCEVKVDPESGPVEIVCHAVVDDVGRAVKPLIVGGQIHGGIVQGVGQAMGEQRVNDPVRHQPVCGSFMDYGMPRADHFPSFATALNEDPSPISPLGVKAGGKGGTTPALAVIVNANVDALRPLEVEDVTIHATPFRV